MHFYDIPNDIVDRVDKINFVYYENFNPESKNKVIFSQNTISFLISGEKEIFYSAKPVKLTDKTVLINASYCLMSEKKTDWNKPYRALLIFFDNSYILKFKLKYPDLINSTNQPDQNNIGIVSNDEFILSYREMLVNLLKNNSPIVQRLAFKALKLEELFLYLAQTYPKAFAAFLSKKINDVETRFKTVVEHNKFSPLTVDELAFLCHMSVSTFKRVFRKHYNESPGKWLFKQRMLYAGVQLKNGKRPSQIYTEIGYKNLSNFIRAFKKHYGQTPRAFERF